MRKLSDTGNIVVSFLEYCTLFSRFSSYVCVTDALRYGESTEAGHSLKQCQGSLPKEVMLFDVKILSYFPIDERPQHLAHIF